MRDDLGNLSRLDAVIEGQVQIERHLHCLVARDQGGDRDNTAISGRQARTFPHLSEQARSCVYFSSAGAIIRTSALVGFELGILVCSA
jgi:hypothetical protein